jgi:hypothetical protein
VNLAATMDAPSDKPHGNGRVVEKKSKVTAYDTDQSSDVTDQSSDVTDQSSDVSEENNRNQSPPPSSRGVSHDLSDSLDLTNPVPTTSKGAELLEQLKSSGKKSVSFGLTQVRFYPIIPGDHPECMMGPSVSLQLR